MMMNEIQIVWDNRRETVASAHAIVKRWQQGYRVTDVRVIRHRCPAQFEKALTNRLSASSYEEALWKLAHPPG